MPLELLSLPLPLLLVALATVLVLLLLSLILSLEAVLDDIRISLCQREVFRNRRQGVLGHVLDLLFFRYDNRISYLKETALDLVTTQLIAMLGLVLDSVNMTLSMHVAVPLTNLLNGIVSWRWRSMRALLPHAWYGGELDASIQTIRVTFY